MALFAVSFHLTLILAGHGCFIQYLVRMGRISDPRCVYCGEEDVVKYTILVCVRWDHFRFPLNGILDCGIIPEDVQNLLRRSTDENIPENSELKRAAVKRSEAARRELLRTVDAILEVKQSDERLPQAK